MAAEGEDERFDEDVERLFAGYSDDEGVLGPVVGGDEPERPRREKRDEAMREEHTGVPAFEGETVDHQRAAHQARRGQVWRRNRWAQTSARRVVPKPQEPTKAQRE